MFHRTDEEISRNTSLKNFNP